MSARAISRVCVVGAGLAGLACAVGVAGRGAAVEVFDLRPRAPALPAFVDVVPNMLRDLVALRVAEDCVRAGFAYTATSFVDRQGRTVCEVPYDRLAGARHPVALGIDHGALHRVLEHAATDRGVAVQRGVEVRAVDAAGSSACLHLSDGRRVEADLVVLATGAESSLGATLFPQRAPLPELEQTWWYAHVRRPAGLDMPSICLGSPGHRVVLVPIGTATAGLALIEPSSTPAPTSPAAHLRRALADFAPRLRRLAAQITDDMPVASRRVRSGLLSPPWNCGAVLAVGDCAHAMPPHLGQSAAQAVEDAVVLSELFADDLSLGALSDAFERRRLERARVVQALALTAARWDLEPHGGADLRLLIRQLMNAVAQPA